MSIYHQWIITCDQNPLPNKCNEKIRIIAPPDALDVVTPAALLKRDWGTVDVHGKDAHYCPYHRPVR